MRALGDFGHANIPGATSGDGRLAFRSTRRLPMIGA